MFKNSMWRVPEWGWTPSHIVTNHMLLNWFQWYQIYIQYWVYGSGTIIMYFGLYFELPTIPYHQNVDFNLCFWQLDFHVSILEDWTLLISDSGHVSEHHLNHPCVRFRVTLPLKPLMFMNRKSCDLFPVTIQMIDVALLHCT